MRLAFGEAQQRASSRRVDAAREDRHGAAPPCTGAPRALMADDEGIIMQARSKENDAPCQHAIKSENIVKYRELAADGRLLLERAAAASDAVGW